MPPRGGGHTGGECFKPPNQRRTMRIAQVAPGLPGGVSPTTQGKPMIMTNTSFSLPIPGYQDACS